MRVAIANRGEVAVRIIRACQELGYASILIHSTADKNTPAYRMADETLEIDGDSPAETYLAIDKVVAAVLKSRCDLVHPGFGFLSENAGFVARLEKEGVNFIGPKSQTIKMVGNKIHAKALAQKVGVPVVPSYAGNETNPAALLAEAKKIGFPCIVKAASGGGGKGMKVVTREEDFNELLASAQREALAAFGSDIVFIEKYLQQPRHVEVQIVFDKMGKGLHFFERDCSVQRRHQKIVEETPSLVLSDALRDQVTQAALKIAKAADYVNAGTVEFLIDHEQNFYFMELNTRLQVEHTVTEMVCGIDFVKLQFRVAQGFAIPYEQADIRQRGHALEVRVYAENPAQEFLPSMGKIGDLQLALGPHRRFDFGYGPGDEITPYYDPMIGKIITWANSREENIDRMHATLSETLIFGVHTNIEFLKSVLENANFRANKLSTFFLQEEFKEGYTLPPLTPAQIQFGESAKKAHVDNSANSGITPGVTAMNYQSPWSSFK